MNIKHFLLIAAISLTGQVFGNEAVSDINAKVDSSYGHFNSSDGWILEGSASLPIADTLGFQFDALHTDIGEVDFSGFGGHLFWRDHEVGLLGIAFGGLWRDEVNSFELSVEGEYYFSWITLGARTGYSSIRYDDYVPFIEAGKDAPFGLLYATAYPVEDLSITVGVENRFDNNSLRLNAEYQLPVAGLSVFSRTMIAENDYEHVSFGLRYYFGGKKSLKQRHRHDDPRNIVRDILFGIGTYGAEYNERGNQYIKDIIRSNEEVVSNAGVSSFNFYGSSTSFNSYGISISSIDSNDATYGVVR